MNHRRKQLKLTHDAKLDKIKRKSNYYNWWICLDIYHGLTPINLDAENLYIYDNHLNHIFAPKNNKINYVKIHPDYRGIISIHNFTYLTVLDCQGSGLSELPVAPHLIYLNCNRARLITQIPVYPKLKYLNIKFTNITNLPILPELLCLNADYTNIITITQPKLLELKCKKSEMYYINAPQLTRLICHDTNVRNINHLNKLQQLICNAQIKLILHRLPDLSEIKFVDNYYHEVWPNDLIIKQRNEKIQIILRKYVNKWQLFVIKRRAYKLALACQIQYFNPDYKFYKLTPEFLHFIHIQNQ